MNSIRVLAFVLIAAGALALAYRSFSYTKETQQAKLGPIELSVKETQTVDIPIWAGIAAIAAGGAMLFVRRQG
jgi:hypothetical protein